MNEIITEKNYPIRNIWLIRKFFPTLIFVPVILLTLISGGINSRGATFAGLLFVGGTLFIPIIPIIIDILRRSNFHYAFDNHFMVFHQGIISKQNRNVLYGRIQGVFVNQGLSDKIFGLASLTIEDFSDGGRSVMDAGGYVDSGKSRRESIGFIGNKIHIPGLKKGDAEALKEIISQKIRENPIEDSQSGL